MSNFKHNFKIGLINLISKETLQDYYNKGYSGKRIAEIYNCGNSSISKLNKIYGLTPPSYGRAKIFTKEKLYELYFLKKMSWKEIALQYNCQPSLLAHYFKKYKLKPRGLNGSFMGQAPWNKGKSVKEGTIDNTLYIEGIRKSRKYGKDHVNFKGGYIDKNGFVELSIRGKRKLESRHVMEKHIGRKLRSDEIVHHVNDDTSDNRIINLIIVDRHIDPKLHVGSIPAIRSKALAKRRKELEAFINKIKEQEKEREE